MPTQHHHDTVLEREALKTKPPAKYQVTLLNDDFTPMDFVILILQEYFNKAGAEAERIMLAVHVNGKGICGLYSKDVAETKVTHVLAHARKDGHPLQCVMEAV